MARHEVALPAAQVESVIFTVRGQKVILDSDLAALYGVTTKQLNQQVKRNTDRFPVDFAFQLTAEEIACLRSQFATSKSDDQPQVSIPSDLTASSLRSQFVTSKGRGGRRYLPYAFTEHGAIMAATVLNSPEAVRVSVFVVRAFVKMREALAQSQAMADKLAELERKLTERLDTHEQAIVLILAELRGLMAPPPDTPKPQIGFTVREALTRYRTRRRK